MFHYLSFVLFFFMLLRPLCVPAIAQKVKEVPAPYTSPASGQQMYVSYCASCHGKDGKGSGPAAPTLKQAPPDLTLLATSNGGKFPQDHIMSVITGKADVSAHGSQDMPVWGPVFWKLSQGHPEEVQQRVTNVTNYLKSIQAK